MWDAQNDAAAPAITPGKSQEVFLKQLTRVGHCLGNALLLTAMQSSSRNTVKSWSDRHCPAEGRKLSH